MCPATPVPCRHLLTSHATERGEVGDAGVSSPVPALSSHPLPAHPSAALSQPGPENSNMPAERSELEKLQGKRYRLRGVIMSLERGCHLPRVDGSAPRRALKNSPLGN